MFVGSVQLLIFRRSCVSRPGGGSVGDMPFFQPSLDDMNKEVLAWDVYTMLGDKPMYLLRKVPVR